MEADWSEAPIDLLELVVKRLYRLPDHIGFSEVCSSWRSVASENRCHVAPNQFPGIMVEGISRWSQTRRFLQLDCESGFFQVEAKGAVTKLLAVPHRWVCRGSQYGWLFLVKDNLDMMLLNPFTGAEIQLPSARNSDSAPLELDTLGKYYVFKAVYSSNPSFQPSPTIIILCGGAPVPRLAFCKPLDKLWTIIKSTRKHIYPEIDDWCMMRSFDQHDYLDVIYYKNQVYALTNKKDVVVYDIDAHTRQYRITRVIYYTRISYTRTRYLVEMEGKLHQIVAKKIYECTEDGSKEYDSDELDGDLTEDEGEEDDDDYDSGKELKEMKEAKGADSYEEIKIWDENDSDMIGSDTDTIVSTYGFNVFRLDDEDTEDDYKWVKVECLGDNALFLGNCSYSFSLRASDNPRCIPNCIYFINGESIGDAKDMGIYSLRDQSVQPLVATEQHITYQVPVWVTRAIW